VVATNWLPFSPIQPPPSAWRDAGPSPSTVARGKGARTTTRLSAPSPSGGSRSPGGCGTTTYNTTRTTTGAGNAAANRKLPLQLGIPNPPATLPQLVSSLAASATGSEADHVTSSDPRLPPDDLTARVRQAAGWECDRNVLCPGLWTDTGGEGTLIAVFVGMGRDATCILPPYSATSIPGLCFGTVAGRRKRATCHWP